MDALKDAREQLATRLLTEAPPGYKARIITLAVLWIILFVQSLVFSAVWFRDCHRQGRSMKIISIQKTVRGSLINVQALCVYALAHVGMSVFACIRQALLYSYYFANGHKYLETLFYVFVLAGVNWGALAFAFSQFKAAIFLFGKNPNSIANKRGWVPLYNAAFVIFPLVWLAVTLTQGITLVIAEEKTFKSGKEVLPLLDAVLADPTGMTPAILMKMQSLQTIIESNLPIVIKQRKGICLIAMVYSVCFGLIGSGGLYVIRQLRESIGETSGVLYGNRQFVSPPTSGQVGQQGSTSAHSQDIAIPQSFGRSALSKGMSSRESDEEANSLPRLLRNLQISVPLYLTLATYLPVALGVLYVNGTRPAWLWEEFRNDFFTWPWALINNIIFACFLYNGIQRPGRWMFTYNTSTARTYPSTGSQQRSAGKLTADMDASAAHHVLNVELERAYSHPFPKGSGRAANLEKEEHVLTESHLNEKIGYA